MELNIFIKELESSLVKRGINPDVANRHVHTLQRTFTVDDLNEIDHIQSTDEIEEIADSIALILMKNKIKLRPSAQNLPEQSQALTPPSQQKPADSRSESSGYGRYNPHERPSTPPVTWEQNQQQQEDDFFEEYTGEDKTKKGFYTFWLAFILTLPLTAVLAALFFGVFAAAFVALAGIIVGLIAVLIAGIALGAGISLVGIIFGITQLFTFPAAGIYEIGQGVMVIGVVMFAGILIYNVAIHFLPWVIRKVAVLLKFCCQKLRDLFLHLRRECYRL